MQNSAQPILRAHSLPTEVANRLRLAIDRGDYSPSGKLPSQEQLAKAYGVSRPVIREALSLLKSDGLIISQQGRGQFVNPEGSSVFRLEANISDHHALMDLFDFLLSFEVTATELAAVRRTPAELQAIDHSLKALQGAIQRNESGVKEDMQFHQAIVRASHNDYYITFSEFLDNQVRRMIRTARTNTAQQRGLVHEVQQEHEAICRAIHERDRDRARIAAANHLTNAARRLKLGQNKNMTKA